MISCLCVAQHLILCYSKLQYLKALGVFWFLHLQESWEKYVFICPQQLPSCDEIIKYIQGGCSHGTWGGQFELGCKGEGWDGLCCSCTAVALCTNNLLPQESARRRHEEKEHSSLHSVLPPLHLHKQWEAEAAQLHPHTCKPFHGLISSLLHILPQKWVYLLNRKTDFFWWNILRWSVSVYENGGLIFLKNLHFLKVTGNYFKRKFITISEIFLHLQSLPCREVSSIFLHETFNMCIHFLFQIRKKIQTP